MKTITLDEDAYERLKSWKRRGGDSFSAVVKRVVPRAGTLEAMARYAVERAPSVEARDALLESAVENRSAAKHDPWTSGDRPERPVDRLGGGADRAAIAYA